MNIHFIWYGPFKDPLPFKTINDADNKLSGNYKIHFWCSKEALTNYINVRAGATQRTQSLNDSCGLSRHVIIHDISSFNELVPYALGFGSKPRTLQSNIYGNAVSLLEKMTSYEAYAAVKDLMELIILYTYGGLYLDTTCEIMADRAPKKNIPYTFREALERLKSEPNVKVPFLYTEKNEQLGPSDLEHLPDKLKPNNSYSGRAMNSLFRSAAPIRSTSARGTSLPLFQVGDKYLSTHRCQIDANTFEDSIKMGVANSWLTEHCPEYNAMNEETYAAAGVVMAPRCDIWAMYSPSPKNACIYRMLDAYITRAVYAGIIPPQRGAQNLTVWGDDTMRMVGPSTSTDKRNTKNQLVSSLAMYSIQDGLINTYPANYIYGWSALEINPSGEPTCFGVSDLGILKYAKNSWK